MKTTKNAPTRFLSRAKDKTVALIQKICKEQAGFICGQEQFLALISDPATAQMGVLVRRNMGREIVPVNEVLAWVEHINERGASDWVRDISLPADFFTWARKKGII